MYQKHHRNDELFTSASLSFSMLLLSLFLVYKSVTSNQTSDINYYFYIGVCVFLCGLFLYNFIMLLTNYNFNKLDIGIDFEQECILLKNGRKKVAFTSISLMGYNPKKKDVRLLINGKIYGFLRSTLRNEKNQEISEEEILYIASFTRLVKYQHLYNYGLMIAILAVIALYLFAFLQGSIDLFGIEVNVLYFFIAVIVFYILIDQANRFRYRHLGMEEKSSTIDNE